MKDMRKKRERSSNFDIFEKLAYLSFKDENHENEYIRTAKS